MAKPAVIPTYPGILLNYFVFMAKDVFEEQIGENEDVDLNLMNAHVAHAIWQDSRKRKEMRRVITREDAMNIAFRITSMLLLIGELTQAGIEDVGLDIELCSVVASMPLKAGESYDMDDFLQRWHYNQKNRGN